MLIGGLSPEEKERFQRQPTYDKNLLITSKLALYTLPKDEVNPIYDLLGQSDRQDAVPTDTSKDLSNKLRATKNNMFRLALLLGTVTKIAEQEGVNELVSKEYEGLKGQVEAVQNDIGSLSHLIYIVDTYAISCEVYWFFKNYFKATNLRAARLQWLAENYFTNYCKTSIVTIKPQPIEITRLIANKYVQLKREHAVLKYSTAVDLIADQLDDLAEDIITDEYTELITLNIDAYTSNEEQKVIKLHMKAEKLRAEKARAEQQEKLRLAQLRAYNARIIARNEYQSKAEKYKYRLESTYNPALSNQEKLDIVLTYQRFFYDELMSSVEEEQENWRNFKGLHSPTRTAERMDYHCFTLRQSFCDWMYDRAPFYCLDRSREIANDERAYKNKLFQIITDGLKACNMHNADSVYVVLGAQQILEPDYSHRSKTGTKHTMRFFYIAPNGQPVYFTKHSYIHAVAQASKTPSYDEAAELCEQYTYLNEDSTAGACQIIELSKEVLSHLKYIYHTSFEHRAPEGARLV